MSMHTYEVRPRKDRRDVDLSSNALPFGRLCYAGPNAASNTIGYALRSSRSHDAVIRVCDDAGNVIATHQARWRLQRTVAALLIVQNCLRCGFAHFKLCAHLLNLSLQVSKDSLEILMLLRNGGL